MRMYSRRVVLAQLCLVVLSEAWARLLKDIRGPGGVVVVPNALDAEQFALSRGDRGRFGIPLDRIVALFI